MSSPRRIAHLSDLHLLSPKNDGYSAGAGLMTRFVSLGRTLDPAGRAAGALDAMKRARGLGAEHLVLTGDLTEIGLPSEFEVLASVLSASGFAADEITIVPGNHDRYAGAEAWLEALGGVLAPWARNAARGPGAIVDLGDLRLLPLDVTRAQSVMRSAGFVTGEILDGVARRLADPGLARVPLAILQHHPPFQLAPLWHHIDGLVGYEDLARVIGVRERVQVLHGHLHRPIDREVVNGIPRVLGAPAVVDGAASFRMYDATQDGLAPLAEARPEAQVPEALSSPDRSALT